MLKEFELDEQGNEWKRLVNEVEMLRRLTHPHIVEVHAVFQSSRAMPPVAYLQLPYYARGDAARWLDECSPELWKRQRMLMQLAHALRHLHEHGFAHGDLKLENVLISEEVRSAPCGPRDPCGTLHSSSPPPAGGRSPRRLRERAILQLES